MPLANGLGNVVRADSGHEVLLGPVGWLPDVDRYGVVGLRLHGGKLTVEAVDESAYPDLPQQQRVRELLVKHYRLERSHGGTDDLASRPGEVVRALAHARLEDPELLSAPHPPLEELLYLAVEGSSDAHYWRDFAAQQNGTCSFSVTGMPETLRRELDWRARRYGMSFDQYVVAVLGHLAWRTRSPRTWSRGTPRTRSASLASYARCRRRRDTGEARWSP